MMPHIPQKRIRFIILMSLVLLAASWVTDSYGIFEILERKTIDIRMRICRSEKYPPSEIVLILIDESSLRALNGIAGRWPWPRDILGDLIDFLSLSGAKSILMDIMFTEDEVKDISAVGILNNHNPRLVLSTQSAGNVFHAAQMIDDIGDEYNLNLINLPLPVDPSEFKDKIVFIGASAAGVEDLKHTSMASTTPGTFLHASILGNILS